MEETHFRRVAIVNRGEAAMRLIHAVRELNRETGHELTTIALFTEPDRRNLFVREADEAVELGSASFVDPADGRRKSRYLDYRRLEEVLRESRAEAAWVGWGFVAEHARFADLCDRLGVVFIGPEAEVMRRLGDKIASKRLAEQADVPVAPWSGGPVETLEEALAWAERLGYPLVVKATAGGGGRGIRKVRRAEEVGEAFESARSEALQAFGDATVYLERLVEGARHVEVQIVGDGRGTTWAVGVRDCSLQRRSQKVVEESFPPDFTAEEEAALKAAAVRLGDAAGYRSAGTVEFLFDPVSRQVCFMEVNTRLQVEHPVTELTTGLDLVKLQLAVARGERLQGEPPPSVGHAIEARLNAEDPDNGFAPAPGAVELFRLPTGPGLRIDSGVEEGDVVPPDFDSMIAKIIAYGRDRSEALARLRRALAQTAVVIRGGTSNKAFLEQILAHPDVVGARLDVTWLDRLVAAGGHLSRRGAEVALVQAAIEAYDEEVAVEKTRFFSAARRGRPEVGAGIGRTVELRYRGHTYPLRVSRLGGRLYRVVADDLRLDLTTEPLGRSSRRLSCGGRSCRVFSVVQGLEHLVEVEGVPHKVSREEAGVVRAPAPAVVVAISVEEGQDVEPGDRLAVLEAMKMEMSVVAEFPGRVRKVLVRRNVQVPAGSPLLLLEPTGEAAAATATERVSFAPLAAGSGDSGEEEPAATRVVRNLEDLRRLLLGYDIEDAEIQRIAVQHGMLCREVPEDDREALRREDAILQLFVDIVTLFRRQPAEEDAGGVEDTGRRSSEEYLFTYLRDLEARGEGLPRGFLDNLLRALAHYGVEELAPSHELEESLFRIGKSHRRTARAVAPVLAILERRLDDAEALSSHADPEAFRALLERLVEETRERYPAIHDLAREVRYRYFDRPFLERVQQRVYAEMEAHLDALAADPEGPGTEARVEALVECPQPLQQLFSDRHSEAGPALRRILLEVILRRYYRIRPIQDVRTMEVRGQEVVLAEYTSDEKLVHVLATYVDDGRLDRGAALASRLARKTPRRDDVTVDLYVRRDGPLGDADALEAEIRAILEKASFPRRLRRIAVDVTGTGEGGDVEPQHFTFLPDGSGFREDRVYRGLHPMIAKRLELWRLRRFAIERLPSPGDIYAFQGVARENPKDERLFVLAEVRDLTPLEDAEREVVQVPEFERIFMEAMAVIRRFQSRRAPEKRLHWNRVILHVWPPMDLRPEVLRSLVRRLAPATEGLGLEKVVVQGRMPDPRSGRLRPSVLEISNRGGRGTALRFRPLHAQPLEPLTEYDRKVVSLRRRGLVYPYELVQVLAPPAESTQSDLPPGEFIEHDLDKKGRLVKVDRPYGGNEANIVVGLVRNFTARYPEGMTRVLLLGDASKGMGALAEPECRRILAGLDLAEKLGVPVEWFAVSAGAKISMQSGTENMDWIARVLRRLVGFTQDGGEVNLVVPGINVGAQPYWNAEATMLMHTRGILVMTAEGAMVLTGKQALDYSGGVSAEDNLGIGGYERIMGPNGQAQYFARDAAEACQILLRYYEHSYVAPGERFPRRAASDDPRDRDIRIYPHGGDFELVGEVFSEETNPGRKKPFDLRRIMHATIDQDHPHLERWYGMEDAEIAVVWDAHLGGWPVSVVGFESCPLPRLGFVPADGPGQWTSGTLFPLSSKKVARALNAASGSRPVVILANLSGFDGSPESMRKLQLEYGAEIGRAVVNFRGPLVFCVISRYHGGAFVVFSNALHDNMQVAALEGAHASVIGGAPAAAVVFAREVDQRTRQDPRIQDLEERIQRAGGAEKARLRAGWEELYESVRAEKLGEVATEFDGIHSIQRARDVGSVQEILSPARLRLYLIEAVERGMERERASARRGRWGKRAR